MKNQTDVVIQKNTANLLAPGGAKHTMPLVLSPLWGKYREAGKGGCKQVLPLWRGWHVVPGEGVIRKRHPRFCRPQDSGIFHTHRYQTQCHPRASLSGIFHARRYQTKCHSRVSLSGISSLFSNHSFTARSVTPQCRYAGYSGRTAFTLIELLVVVLIIGILAAVALPQYQKAVMKTRYAQLKVLAKSLAEAEEIYHMANGSYSKKLADLDIQLAGGTLDSDHEDQYNFPWGYCYVGIGDDETKVSQACCNNTDIDMEYQQRLNFSKEPNTRVCITFNGDLSSPQNQICKSETGKTGDIYDAFSSFYY